MDVGEILYVGEAENGEAGGGGRRWKTEKSDEAHGK